MIECKISALTFMVCW